MIFSIIDTFIFKLSLLITFLLCSCLKPSWRKRNIATRHGRYKYQGNSKCASPFCTTYDREETWDYNQSILCLGKICCCRGHTENHQMHYSCFFLMNQNPQCILNCTLSFQVAPYCASKWAIEGLTRSLAKELPPGLAAIALSPGVVNTDMLNSCFGSSAALYQTTETW